MQRKQTAVCLQPMFSCLVWMGLTGVRALVQWLDLQAGSNPSLLAWNYYPPKQRTAEGQGAKEFRLHAHADTDFLTLVFQRPGEALSQQ